MTATTLKSFPNLLLEAIDDAFSSLGESVKTSIYFHLETKFGLKKKEIPIRVEDFSDCLERIFGVGARYLEILIKKSLHAKVVCQYKWEGPSWLVPDLTLKEYVELMKLGYEDEGKMGEVEVIINAEEQQEQYT